MGCTSCHWFIDSTDRDNFVLAFIFFLLIYIIYKQLCCIIYIIYKELCCIIYIIYKELCCIIYTIYEELCCIIYIIYEQLCCIIYIIYKQLCCCCNPCDPCCKVRCDPCCFSAPTSCYTGCTSNLSWFYSRYFRRSRCCC